MLQGSPRVFPSLGNNTESRQESLQIRWTLRHIIFSIHCKPERFVIVAGDPSGAAISERAINAEILNGNPRKAWEAPNTPVHGRDRGNCTYLPHTEYAHQSSCYPPSVMHLYGAYTSEKEEESFKSYV